MAFPDKFWQNRRTLVTGCTGFLGTWVVRELLARGATVAGLVRDRVSPSDLFRDRLFNSIRVLRGRVEDRGRMQQILALHEIETVFHLAGDATDPARFDLPIYSAAREAIPTGQVIVPLGAGVGFRESVGVGFATEAKFSIVLPKLPTVYGGGDRRRNRLVPRAARALLSGLPLPAATFVEYSSPHLYAADAARGLLRVAESAALSSHTELDMQSDEFRVECRPMCTGTDVLAALAAVVTISFGDEDARPVGTVLGEPATSLSRAAAETLAWFRTLPHSIAFPDAPPADVARRAA